jgi:TRAP-type C4-dicarboxylate transport system permease small subunit
MRRALDAWYRQLQVALTFLMAALVVPVTMQVLSRYTPLVPRYLWTDEVARFCFVWVIMVGAMIAVRDGTHFDLDILPRSTSPRVAAAQKLFVDVVLLLVGLVFLVYGWQFVRFGWYQTSEISELPMPWIFAAWPLSGLTWMLFLSEKIVDDVASLRRGGGA